ncbi:cell division protein FtsK, partial [Chromobacterium vaccinii]|nr:cell division protein FtsK [Chromobacterium vaccinii]
MWVVVVLLLSALAAAGWLVKSGKMPQLMRKLDGLLGVEGRSERYEPDYFAEQEAPSAVQADDRPDAEPEPLPTAHREEAPRREEQAQPVRISPQGRQAKQAAPVAEDQPPRETIVLPKRAPTASQEPPAELPVLELSREYRRKNRQPQQPSEADDLPVIGLSEMQSNMQQDYLRRQRVRGVEPGERGEDALPLIGSGEVRAA